MWTIVPVTRTVKFQNERLRSCTIKELFEKCVSETLTNKLAKPLQKQWLASAVFRTGVSERDVALIASAVLQDAGLVTEYKNLVVDKNKIRREKKKPGKKIQEKENLDGLKIKSIFFDGRRDKMLFIGKKRTSDIADRKTKNILLCCLNLVLNIWDI
ncbi:hypothetical protein AVEN_59672-1 [Araneus ventricosus]|uniref:Uncharacterized protein n=1 Tax=Araneus ventricosus TaxID=182803 RepID=A0A4Y2BMP8_ARAVE|nr:hypothetical protein AVEN_59672-1 [Araneus ventricosus]